MNAVPSENSSPVGFGALVEAECKSPVEDGWTDGLLSTASASCQDDGCPLVQMKDNFKLS